MRSDLLHFLVSFALSRLVDVYNGVVHFDIDKVGYLAFQHEGKVLEFSRTAEITFEEGMVKWLETHFKIIGDRFLEFAMVHRLFQTWKLNYAIHKYMCVNDNH